MYQLLLNFLPSVDGYLVSRGWLGERLFKSGTVEAAGSRTKKDDEEVISTSTSVDAVGIGGDEEGGNCPDSGGVRRKESVSFSSSLDASSSGCGCGCSSFVVFLLVLLELAKKLVIVRFFDITIHAHVSHNRPKFQFKHKM